MGLNKAKGNMYSDITDTWNIIKGECPHKCKYCYMKQWGKQNPVRFDKKELKTDLGHANIVFAGSSCDAFAKGIEYNWTNDMIEHCMKFDNTYLFQSKNPHQFNFHVFPKKTLLGTTIETNRFYADIMGECPTPKVRANQFAELTELSKYITIEPILDFDLDALIHLIKINNPVQVNIGADTQGHSMPEPNRDKIIDLVHGLEKFTKVKLKSNINRILKVKNVNKKLKY